MNFPDLATTVDVSTAADGCLRIKYFSSKKQSQRETYQKFGMNFQDLAVTVNASTAAAGCLQRNTIGSHRERLLSEIWDEFLNINIAVTVNASTAAAVALEDVQ